MDTSIILLHGLGSHTITLYPLMYYLIYYGGFTNVQCVEYTVDTISYEESINQLNDKLSDILNKETDEPIIIGQSMGGVMANNLHKKGWKVKKSITIGSPLHGASLLNYLKDTLPDFVVNLLHKKSYDYLMIKDRDEIPPHNYNTITMSWPFTEFDGCVFKEEAILEAEKNIHLPWADHRTIFANPRLWYAVLQLIPKD